MSKTLTVMNSTFHEFIDIGDINELFNKNL